MKITNVKVDMFDWIAEPWKTGVGTRFGEGHQLGVVTVETDEGITGNAFLGSSRMGADHFAPGLIQFIKPIIMGRNPQDIGSIWWDLWKMNRSVSTYVIGAIDICLWDINGKIAGQPIHRLLGTCKDSVPVYSSTAYHETKEEYAEKYEADGHTGLPKCKCCGRIFVGQGRQHFGRLGPLDTFWAYVRRHKQHSIFINDQRCS